MRRAVISATLCSWIAGIATAADDDQVVLSVGDEAPVFTLKDDQGNDWKSSEHYGKNVVVVYFYPADMTPGCTKQACAFRDDLPKLKEAGVEVVGVSGDSVRNHQLFKKAHELTFTLLSDPEGDIAKQFGVPYQTGEQSIEREIAGIKETLTRTATIRRWTFVVDKDGKIALKNDSVEAAKDSQAILEFVAKLKSDS